jgi:hypothetical protein
MSRVWQGPASRAGGRNRGYGGPRMETLCR